MSARGRYYRRQANSNHQLTAVEIADLSLQTRNSSWDYYYSIDKSIGDIDMEKVKQAIAQIRRRNEGFLMDEPFEFLKKFELVEEISILPMPAICCSVRAMLCRLPYRWECLQTKSL